jgi:undecaprenyl-diphosphatase
MDFERAIVSSIQQLVISSPMFLALAIFCARWLIFVFVVFCVFLLVSNKPTYRHAVREAAWSALLALFITAVTQYFMQRPRPFLLPFDPTTPITALIPHPFNTSFPSGHTGTSIALASAIMFVNRRWGIAAFIVALIIAFARVMVGVHFPTDILGGIIVGIGSFMCVRFLHGQIRTPDIERSAKRHNHP